LFAVTSGSKITAKSVHLLLFTLIIVGNCGSRRPACKAVHRQLSDTASSASWLVEVNVTVAICKSYDVVKSAFKIRIRHFYDNLTTS